MSGTNIPAAHVYRPSNARLILLDGFVPVPRGAVAAPPVMPSWPVKDPNDVLDYTVDISAAAAGDDGDAVVNTVVAISPNLAGDLALNSAAVDGTLIVLWLSAGNAGTIYSVILTVTLASGRALARTIALPVYDLSGTTSTTAVLTTEAGAVLTSSGGNPIVLGS